MRCRFFSYLSASIFVVSAVNNPSRVRQTRAFNRLNSFDPLIDFPALAIKKSINFPTSYNEQP
jgi:hypothetical protein